jgi:hypothetical protein
VVGDRARIQVGTATHDVGAQFHRRPQHRPYLGALRSGELDRQGDELQVDEVTQPLAHLQQRLDRADADRLVDADVGADGGGAIGQTQQCSLGGPGNKVLLRDRRLVVQPGVDGAAQVASGVGDAIGRQRRVEVGVRLGRGRQQQVAAQVQALGGRQCPWRSDRLDLAGTQANVDDLAGDQPDAAEEQIIPATGVVGSRHVGD